jgi:hypothetical protein
MTRSSRMLIASLAAVLAGCLAAHVPATLAAGQDEKDAGQQQMSPEMEQWMKLASPGEHHHHMNALVGRWNCAIKGWQEGQEVTSTGTATMEWMLGGRYVRENFKSTMMGMPFEGAGVFGYDNVKGVHCSVWIDNMSTGLMVGEGSCSEGGNVITDTAQYMDPMTGTAKKVKSVMRVVSKDELLFTMYDVDETGKETKSMEITYTRMM